jgi:putative transposase
MKFGVIKALVGEHPVRKLCRVLGVARSAYYAAQRKAERPRAKENVRLGGKARELFEASGRTYGSPRLAVALRRAGEPCGRHRVARLMRGAGLRARQKRRFRPRTTDSRHLNPIAPNHLGAREQPPTRPGEVWQADITYVATKEGWLYVAGVLDACTRQIVGWAADDSMPTALVARAFERAIQAHRPGPGLLHHSDRGSQYASDAYRELLRSHGAVASMSRAGNCYDNARMESFWATLKTELIDGQVYATRAEAKSAIFSYIEVFYNRVRLHGALGYNSPVDFENNLN